MDCAVQVVFNSPIAYGKVKELFIAPEGLYTGQVFLSNILKLHLPFLLDPFVQGIQWGGV
jgi:hypothetical protein